MWPKRKTHEEIWNDIPKEDQVELNAIFDGWGLDLECMDNTRVARIGDPDHEEHYERARESGCCGSIDKIHMCSSARQYRIGCNYGH